MNFFKIIIVVVLIVFTVNYLFRTVPENNVKVNFIGARKAYSSLNQSLLINSAKEGKNVRNYKTPEELYEKIFKKNMSLQDGNYVFTGGLCTNGITFKHDSGILYCIDKDNYNPEKCDEYNTVPCAVNQNLPVIYADVNGEKEPNKVIVSKKDNNDIVTFALYNQKVTFMPELRNIIPGSE